MGRLYKVDYSGRQVDIELLQSVTAPGVNIPVDVSVSKSQTKMTTGVEKTVQRYLHLLLTDLGSVHFSPDSGGEILTSLAAGTVTSEADMYYLFAIASDDAITRMAEDDTDTETFGETHEDELITKAELTDCVIDYNSSTVHLSISVSLVSGQSYDFIVPVKTGIL